MKLYGILTIEAPDCSGETIVVDGIQDLENLPGTPVSWNFKKDAPYPGRVLSVRKVTDEKDAEHELLVLAAGKPFVRIEVEALDSLGTEIDRLGFGLGGVLIEREGALLTSVVAKDVALTTKPVHPALRAFVAK